MKHTATATISLALLLSSSLAQAQAISGPNVYAEGNEAVGKEAAGNRKVELPPAPVGRSGKPQLLNPTPMPVTSSGFVYMIETNDGLTECSHADIRSGECQPSTIGTKKRSRIWVVKRNAKWWLCGSPARSAECYDPPAYNGGKGTDTWRSPMTEM